MVGSGEQDYNYASLIVITAVTKKHRIDLKIRKNSELVVGSREQDYNYNIYYNISYSSQLYQKKHKID